MYRLHLSCDFATTSPPSEALRSGHWRLVSLRESERDEWLLHKSSQLCHIQTWTMRGKRWLMWGHTGQWYWSSPGRKYALLAQRNQRQFDSHIDPSYLPSDTCGTTGLLGKDGLRGGRHLVQSFYVEYCNGPLWETDQNLTSIELGAIIDFWAGSAFPSPWQSLTLLSLSCSICHFCSDRLQL